MKTILFFIVIMFSIPSWSTVTVGATDCPDHFEGRVKQIISPPGAQHAFSLNKIVLENQRTLKGEVQDQVIISVLQNGPFIIEMEKEYRVQLRDGKICWMEEI
jgi:hypothetical protein